MFLLPPNRGGRRLHAVVFVLALLLAGCGARPPQVSAPTVVPTSSTAPALLTDEPAGTAEPGLPETGAAKVQAAQPDDAAAGPEPTANSPQDDPNLSADGITDPSSAALGLRAPWEGDLPRLNPAVTGEVTIWHFWARPVRRNALRRVIAMCQQELPNIKVNDVVKPFGDIWTANVAAVATGAGMPDVIVSDRPTMRRDAAEGIYMNLQPWADRDNVTRDQFYGWAWDQATYEGNVYGIPHETDVTVLFYNKTLFQQAGLQPDRPPRTWAEIAEYADKLDKRGPNGELVRVGFFPLWNRGTDIWQYTNSAQMIAPDGKVQINNPQMVETVAWLKSWVDRYGGWEAVQAFGNQFGVAPNDAFMKSGVAMLVDIFGYNSQLQFYRPEVALDNGAKTPMDWGIALLPYNTVPGTWSGGFSLSIPTGADDPEAAWEFIKCATGAAGQVSWARDTQAQPTNLTAATDPVLLADPAWAIVDQALQTSTGGVYLPEYPNWSEQLVSRWEKVWLGELTPQQMLDDVQKIVAQALQ